MTTVEDSTAPNASSSLDGLDRDELSALYGAVPLGDKSPVPGKEAFYRTLGFRRMTTAMAIFENQPLAFERGYLTNA